MKKLLCALVALTCVINLTACGSSSDSSSNSEPTTNYIITNKNQFSDVDHWLSDMWSTLICDMDSYIRYGTSCTGEEYDIEYAISELKASYKKKDEYNDFIHSLDINDENNARLITAWDKLCEQLDILYKKITSETPKANDETYEYNTDLCKQYYSSFEDIEREIKKQKKSSGST